MKTRFFTLSFLLSTLNSCFQGQMPQQKKHDQQYEHCFEMPMRVSPFYDVPSAQVKLLAKRENKRFMVLIINPETDLKELVSQIGITPESLDQWERDFVCVVLSSEEKSAQELIQEYAIKAFPASIKFERGGKVFEQVLYGRVWPGSKPYLSKPAAKELLELYEAGERDRRFLRQALDHLPYLELPFEEASKWRLKLQNAYFNTYSLEELSSYEGYFALKTQVRDIRLEVMDVLFSNRAALNEKFVSLATEYELKNKIDADGILKRAIQKSMETAAQTGDENLFELGLKYKEKFELGYMNVGIAKSILLYHIKRKEDKKVLEAALQYFEENEQWYYSREYQLMYIAADHVNRLSKKREDWIKAESWIANALAKDKPTPTRYGLHVELLGKLGDTGKAQKVREKLEVYKEEFLEFLTLYPKPINPIEFDRENITKKAYKKVEAIPSRFKHFYTYISVEGSLFRQGEKVEPIALLSQSETDVQLLSRVHLLTGSILPVQHIRSYYRTSTFTLHGEYKGGKYK